MRREGDGDIRVLLVGKAGSGKSATGNTLLNDSEFESKRSSSAVTKTCKAHTGTVENRSVTLVDTPASILSSGRNTDSDPELRRALELSSPGAHAILLIFTFCTFTEQETQVLSLFEQTFGTEALRFTLVLFTHAENINSRQLRAQIRGNHVLSDFINRCGGGVCGINNRERTNRRQVRELMEKVEMMVSVNRNSCYNLEMMLENQRRREEENRRQEEEKRAEEDRKEREHQRTLERVKNETERRERREHEERAKILKKLQSAGNKEERLMIQQIKKYGSVITICGAAAGFVSVWRKDFLNRLALLRVFITVGSSTAVGGFTGIFCRLRIKRKFVRVCSSSHEHTGAVRQLLLKAADVVLKDVLAGALMHQFEGENVLPVCVITGAFTAIHLGS